jgi:hypothetical protein
MSFPLEAVLGDFFEADRAGGVSGAGREVYHRRIGIMGAVFRSILAGR